LPGDARLALVHRGQRVGGDARVQVGVAQRAGRLVVLVHEQLQAHASGRAVARPHDGRQDEHALVVDRVQ
jgi:hypothetical protein